MIKYYKRERGEGSWVECDYEEYLRCDALYEMDTKTEDVPSGENMYTISDFEKDVQDTTTGVGNEGFDIKSSLSTLFGGIKNYFESRQLGLNKPLVVANAGLAKTVANKYNYTDVMDKLILQPQRLNATYKELNAALVNQVTYLMIVEQTLPNVLSSLAGMLNGQAVSVYSTGSLTAAKNKAELDLQKLLNGKDTTEAVFSTRFASMMDYQAAYMDFNSVLQRLTRRNPHDVRLNVDRLAQLAEQVHTAAVAGEIEMAPVQIKQLGEMLLALARAVDVYSVATTVLIATGTALNNTADKLLGK